MEANQMTFGVEIECAIPTTALMNAGWHVGAYHVGSEIPGFRGWKAMRDGSLMNFSPSMTALEVVSPVLTGRAGFERLAEMVATIKAMGGKVNSSCGFHVHVGFSSDVKSLVRLIFLTANVERALFSVTGTQNRCHNHYCKTIKGSNFGGGYSALKEGTVSSLQSLRRKSPETGDRYHVLNLTNLLTNVRPTVEFRVFAGTLNVTKMFAYIQICLGLVQQAVERKARTNWDSKSVAYFVAAQPGGSDLRRLFGMLGWTRHYGAAHKTYGVVVAESIEAGMKVCRKMARKFDGVAGTDAPELE